MKTSLKRFAAFFAPIFGKPNIPVVVGSDGEVCPKKIAPDLAERHGATGVVMKKQNGNLPETGLSAVVVMKKVKMRLAFSVSVRRRKQRVEVG